MYLTSDQKIAGGLVGAAALLGYAAWKRRKDRTITCADISNRLGASISSPCPTENFVDVCSDSDFLAWRDRLSMQLETVNRLRQTLEDYGMLDEALLQSFKSYAGVSASMIGQSAPVWTNESDISPITNQVLAGCTLLNAGNARLAAAGHAPSVVQEDVVVQSFKARADGVPGWMLPVAVIGGAAGVAWWMGRTG